MMTMKTRGNSVWVGLISVTLAAATAAPVTTFGADRMVLCEEFTATT
jgi:hypothetical protein